MKSLICPFDARSGVLYSKCESKLESGTITRDDVQAAIKLARLADRSQDVDKFTLLRGAQVNMEKVQKIAKTVRSKNIELLIEFEDR